MITVAKLAITSAKEVSPCNARRLSICSSVCLSVRLSVCLLVNSRNNYSTDLHENFTSDVSVDKEELIKFLKSSASVSVYRNVLKDSSTL